MNLRSKEDIIEALKTIDIGDIASSAPWGSSTLDHRDVNRLLAYLTYDEAISAVGNVFKEGAEEEWGDVKPWNVETVTKNMQDSLEFAFEKALNQRGISASLMYDVMCMWVWVIQDDDLLNDAYYSNYGLPFLYRVRDKYFPDMRV